MAKQNVFSNLFKKGQKFQPIHAVLLVVLFIAGAFAIRQYIELNYSQSDASCYGYQCYPVASIGGRIAGGGYNNGEIYYGILNVHAGDMIELTWEGQNVTDCRAIGNWTNYRGTFMPLTVFPKRLFQSRTFGVRCKKGRQTVEAYLSVNVEGPNQQGDDAPTEDKVDPRGEATTKE